MGTLVAIATVVGTLILCGIIIWIVLGKMKKEAYTGVVTAKNQDEREGANDSTYTSYSLVVKLDNGGEKRVQVGRKLWEQFAVGNKIVKEAGKYNPTKG